MKFIERVIDRFFDSFTFTAPPPARPKNYGPIEERAADAMVDRLRREGAL